MSAPPDTSTAPTRTIAIRVSPRLERELNAIATRDENNISATVRRLLTIGLRTERRDADRGAR